MFALAGRMWAEGKIPYRDFWDNKPPGIFLVNAAVVRAGGGFGALACVEGAIALGAALAFAALCGRMLSPWWRLVGFAVFGIYANQFALTEAGNYTERYLILPATFSGLCAVVGLQRRSAWTMAGCGAMAATAAMFKPVGLAAALAAGGVLAVEGSSILRNPSSALESRHTTGASANRDSAGLFLGLVGGVVIGLAPWCVWAAWRGVLGEMLDASVVYNLSYVRNSGAGWTAQWGRVLFLFARMPVIWVGMAGLAAWMVGNSRDREDQRDQSDGRTGREQEDGREEMGGRENEDGANAGEGRGRVVAVFALLWFAADLAGALAGGYAYGHYFLACVPSATFAGMMGLEKLWGGIGAGVKGGLRESGGAARAGRALVVLAVAAAAPLIALQARHVSIAHERATRYAEEEAALERELERIAGPGVPVLVWGHYFVPQARYGHSAPTRTLSLLHLARSPRAARRIGAELEEMFAKNPPAAIVEPLVEWENFPPLDAGFAGGKLFGWPEQAAVVEKAREEVGERYDPPIRFEKGALRANIYRRR